MVTKYYSNIEPTFEHTCKTIMWLVGNLQMFLLSKNYSSGEAAIWVSLPEKIQYLLLQSEFGLSMLMTLWSKLMILIDWQKSSQLGLFWYCIMGWMGYREETEFETGLMTWYSSFCWSKRPLTHFTVVHYWFLSCNCCGQTMRVKGYFIWEDKYYKYLSCETFSYATTILFVPYT